MLDSAQVPASDEGPAVGPDLRVRAMTWKFGPACQTNRTAIDSSMDSSRLDSLRMKELSDLFCHAVLLIPACGCKAARGVKNMSQSQGP